jgi:uncharacterized coiled-coil DUF342 family protein
MNLPEHERTERMKELELEIAKAKEKVLDIWEQHLKISEKAGELLQTITKLECELEKLKEEIDLPGVQQVDFGL